MPNAILYARVSPRNEQEQEQGASSIEGQLAACRAWCHAQATACGGEFIDMNRSGADPDRPGLWAAIAALESGDVLLVAKLDRLARSVYLSALLDRDVGKLGARIISAANEGTWEDSPDQRFMRSILRAYAEFEREVIRARTKAGLARKAALGLRISRRPPYGWCLDPADPKRLAPEPVEQTRIAEILISAKAGMDACQISSVWNRKFYSERNGYGYRGGRWTGSRVASILRRAGAGPP